MNLQDQPNHPPHASFQLHDIKFSSGIDMYGPILSAVPNKHVPKARPQNKFTKTQDFFIEWNAQRLGIPIETSQARYMTSWSAIRNGHAGAEYRSFNKLSYELFQVFANDSQAEAYAAYALHAPMHFLRMLSYPEPQWQDNDPIIQALIKQKSVDILDYGCGLAQKSRTLAVYLTNKGILTHLHLVDIATIRKDFLLWWGKKAGISVAFLDSTASIPIPNLPQCDICIATEFFEHVYEPVKYLEKLHTALRNRGILVTEVSDHQTEFMHVSPNLKSVRDRIHELDYEELKTNVVFRKKVAQEK